MNKLTQKEMFMVIILVNIVFYYLGYLIIATPLMKWNESVKTQYIEAKNENTRIKNELVQNDTYVKNITTLENEREEFYGQTFPYAREEIIHQFISEKLKAHQLNMTKIDVSEEVEKKTANTQDNAQNVESIFKSYMVEINYTGPYKNSKDFLNDMEGLERTSLITDLDISTAQNGTTTTVVFNLVTVDKGDENEKDTIFNFSAAGAQGTGGNDLNLQ